MSQTFHFTLLLLLSLLTISSSSPIYNVDLSCGPCRSTTGCPGNTCLLMTGDLNEQTCYGQIYCDNSTVNVTNATIGSCGQDFGATTCDSQLCLYVDDVDVCYSSGGYCLNGASFFMDCANRELTTEYTGGVYGPNTVTAVTNLTEDCDFSQVQGSYNPCLGDIFGGSCDCCVNMNVTGISQATGTCIHTADPTYKFKATVVAADNRNMNLYGQQIVLSVLAILALMLLL